MAKPYQTPEKKTRLNTDAMLAEAGWKGQDKKKINFGVGLGVAVRAAGVHVPLIYGAANQCIWNTYLSRTSDYSMRLN